MNKKRWAFTGGVALVALAMVTVSLWSGTEPAQANPPGAPEGWKKVGQFNYIAVPDGTVPNCDSGGSRIFTERGASAQYIEWSYDPAGRAVDIIDGCTTAVDGDHAQVTSNALATYKVYVVLLGPKSADNFLKICRNVPGTAFGTDDTECELGYVSLDRGGGTERYTFPKKLFDDAYESEIWEMTQGSNFRIAQIRLYEEQ